MGAFASEAFSKVREHRDLVLIDYRGTGGSAPLHCKLFRTSTQLGGPTLYPRESIRHCADSLSRHADLTQYTTSRIVEDLEHVKRRMRWPAVNLYGTSYGSRVAFEWMRRYPSSVRAAIVKAVAPPELAAPMNYARDGESAFGQLQADCRAQETCQSAFPAIRLDADSVLAHAGRGLVRGVSSSGDTVTVQPEAIAGAIFAALQSASERAAVPALLASAVRGASLPLANAVIRVREQIDRVVAVGMHVSVMCSEVARLNVEEAEREARNTLFGATRVRNTVEACRAWPAFDAPARAWQRTPLAQPVLLVSGANDPNLPPIHAERMLSRLPRGRHVVLAGVAHGWWNVAECGAAFAAQFIARASARDLDVSCAARSSAPPLVVPRR